MIPVKQPKISELQVKTMPRGTKIISMAGMLLAAAAVIAALMALIFGT